MRLANQVAVVTGAQKGIGAAVARCFAREGASVILNWLDDESATAALVEEIQAAGGQVTPVQGDVANAADVVRLFEAAEAAGGPSVLVNNAGIFPRVELLDMTEDDWDRVQDVNLKGSWRCLQAAARSMVAAGRPGAVLNLSSMAFWSGGGRGVHYAATKGGLIGMTRAAARDLAAHRIRVNAIAPGLVDTDQPRDGMTEAEIEETGRNVPLGRIADPDDIADSALFLCCDESRHITGQTLHVNGGQVYY